MPTLPFSASRDRSFVAERQGAPAQDLRAALVSLPGVRDARVEVLGDEVTRVVVMTLPERSAASLIPPIRFAAAQRGLSLDPALIEILTVRESDPLEEERRKLAQVSVTRTEGDYHVRVSMTLHGDVLVGESEGSEPEGLLSVATAVLRSLEPVLPRRLRIHSIDQLAIGGEHLIVVSIMDGANLLVGSGVTERDPFAATARATLQAINRVLTLVDESEEPDPPS